MGEKEQKARDSSKILLGQELVVGPLKGALHQWVRGRVDFNKDSRRVLKASPGWGPPESGWALNTVPRGGAKQKAGSGSPCLDVTQPWSDICYFDN